MSTLRGEAPWLVLVMGFLFGGIIALMLVVQGIVLGVRSGRRSRAVLLRAAAWVVLGAAVGMYAWGMGCLSVPVLAVEDGGAGSSPALPCREADMDKAMHVIDTRPRLLPLKFECLLTDGGSYTVPSAVPAYVNPSAAVFALAGLAALIGSAAAKRRAASSPSLPDTPQQRACRAWR